MQTWYCALAAWRPTQYGGQTALAIRRVRAVNRYEAEGRAIEIMRQKYTVDDGWGNYATVVMSETEDDTPPERPSNAPTF